MYPCRTFTGSADSGHISAGLPVESPQGHGLPVQLQVAHSDVPEISAWLVEKPSSAADKKRQARRPEERIRVFIMRLCYRWSICLARQL